MTERETHINRDFLKVEGVWICVSEIEALKIGFSGIDVYLMSGSRITMETERTQENLDKITRQLLVRSTDEVPMA